MSHGQRLRAGKMGQTPMNTAPQCYLDFFGVASSRTGLRIRNDEVVGSIPTSSTKIYSTQSLWGISAVPRCA
jgi:hypothetical protein